MLNSSSSIKKLNQQAMANHLANFPQQCLLAYQQAKQLKIPSAYQEIREIVIVGMGGSGISGELIKYLPTKCPVVPVHNYQLPSFVKRLSLVILVSYSGQTKEVISCLKEARQKKAKILVISSGGQLLNQAKKLAIPYFKIDYLSPPRVALSWLFFGLLVIFKKLALITLSNDEIKKIINQLTKFNQDLIPKQSTKKTNLAKRLGQRLSNHCLLIISADFLTPVSYRWQTQFAENGKQIAFSLACPELCHNFIETISTLQTNNFFVFLLQSKFYQKNNQKIINLLINRFKKYKINYYLVKSSASTQIGQLLSCILLGDWISFYLAISKNIDPIPVKEIEYFKQLINKK